MLARRIASRYAEALFGLAQQQEKTAAWAEELRAVAQVVNGSPDLRRVLTHPEVSLQRKEALLNKAFQGQVSTQVLAVVYLLIKRGHDPDMQVIAEIFQQRWNTVRRMMPVSVRTAIPLSDSQAQQLAAALAKRTGSTIQLQQSIDANLIAGLVITMGDRVIDASVRTFLAEMRTAMTTV